MRDLPREAVGCLAGAALFRWGSSYAERESAYAERVCASGVLTSSSLLTCQ